MALRRRARRLTWGLPLAAALASAGMFAGGGPAAADSPAPAPLPTLSPGSGLGAALGSTASSLSADALEAALLVKLNAERAAAGLPGLAIQPWAASVARAHSQDMAAARDIWHNHTGFLDIARQTINAYVDGENVAEAGTLDEADALLMNSPPHRSNILYPLFNQVGIGVALDAAGYVYVTQDFVDIRLPGAATTAATTHAPAPSAVRPAAAAAAAPAAAPASPAAVPLVDPAPPVNPAPPPSAAPAATPPAPAPPATTVASTNHRPGPAMVPLAAVALSGLAGGATAAAFRRRLRTR